MDLRKETQEALDIATRAVNALPTDIASSRERLQHTAFVTLLDVCTQLARLVGVPNAVEPDVHAQSHVETQVEQTHVDSDHELRRGGRREL